MDTKITIIFTKSQSAVAVTVSILVNTSVLHIIYKSHEKQETVAKVKILAIKVSL